MKINSLLKTFGIAAGLLVSSTASADILYGDFSGDSVDYLDVREDDQGLFGSPTITGDSLNFTPLNFEAVSNGGGIAFVDGTVAFTVMSTDDLGVQTLTLEESGAFALDGIGTDITSVEVAAIIAVNILEVDGNPFAGPSQIVTGSSLFSADLLSDPGLGQAWQGAITFDIASAASSQLGITGDITKAAVVIDNQLIAVSESGTVSFIDKKLVDAVTVTIPEPTSLVLLSSGALFLLRRRAA